MKVQRDFQQSINLVLDLEARVYHVQTYDLSTQPSLLDERYVVITHSSLARRFAIATSRPICGLNPAITEVGEMITVEGQGKRLTCYPIGQTIDTVVLPDHMLDMHVGTNVAREY